MKKVILAVLLVACFVGVSLAADTSSVVRPGVTPGAKVAAHPFINLKAMQAATPKVFVSDAINNVVNIYTPAGKQIGQLSGFVEPQGLTTDAKGNLYVADTVNSRIQIYAPPYTKAPTSLADPGQYPVGVSVLNNGQFIGVTNIIDTNGGPGSVMVYKKHKAGKVILSSAIARVYFGGFDKSGNFYVDGQDSNGGVVVGEVAKLSTTGKTFKALKYNATITFPGGVLVTTAGKIAVTDQSGAAIYSFNAPKGGSLGTPKTTPITGSSDAVSIAFTSTDKDVWTADAGNLNAAEFAYPKGGSALKTISVSTGQPIGVAVVPAQVP